MHIRFLGAAGTVTGSRYLLEDDGRSLLVDCGLFQGYKALRLRNWDRIPFNPRDIDAVVLTHAHIDHSGFLPRLVKLGFRGQVHCSEATLELCRLLLPDAGRHARYARLYSVDRELYPRLADVMHELGRLAADAEKEDS